MALDDDKGEPVTGGWWLYDGKVRRRIEIIARNFDYNWRLMFGDGHMQPDPDEKPMPLNPDGVIFYVFRTGSPGFQTVTEAKAWVDAQPWGPVTWD